MMRRRFRWALALFQASAWFGLLAPTASQAQTEQGVTAMPRAAAIDRSEWDAITARISEARIAGETAELTVLAEQALTIAERSFGPGSREALSIESFLAGLYLADDRLAEAEPLFLRALAQARPFRGRDDFDTWNIVASLATLYNRLGRFAEADPLFERALADSRWLMNPQHPDSLVATRALVRNRLQDPTLAAGAIGPARQLATAIRERRGSMASPGLLFTQKLGDLGNRSVDVCADLGLQKTRERRDATNDLDAFALLAEAAWFSAGRQAPDHGGLEDEAFAALQELVSRPAGKAVEQMAARRLAEQRAAVLGETVRQRQAIDDLLAANADLRAQEVCNFGSATQTAEQFLQRTREQARLDGEHERLEAGRDALDNQIRTIFPEYFAQYGNQPLSIREAQAQLAPDEAILIVSQSAFGIQSMAVSKTDVAWARSGWTTDQAADAVTRLLWDVGVDVRIDVQTAARWLDEGGGTAFDRQSAYAIYRQLIEPLTAVLAGKKELYVAAGGLFSSLPLGILVTRPPQGRDGDPAALRATAWFADAHALTIVPSLPSWLYLRRAKLETRPGEVQGIASFAGFGDPALSGKSAARGVRSAFRGPDSQIFRTSPPADGGVADVDQIRRLARLPGTGVELESIRAALQAPQSALYLRDRATERAVRAADLSDVRILAFATHGLLTGELADNAEPGLIFTPPGQPSDADDGFLSMSEIAAMTLAADWVILSACNTAGGDCSAGAPGLSGLARAFFYAGSRSLLVSHWPVLDDVAARLTVDAIRGRQDHRGWSRAQALQAAMQAIRNNTAHDTPGDSWAHPRAWGPFSLIGGDRN